ncbi:MAG: DUF11 domain-containing protein, partial [Anaerolineales bacterium]|nr:DUF11 domain-containing protein [Anaerolineales bacterium]
PVCQDLFTHRHVEHIAVGWVLRSSTVTCAVTVNNSGADSAQNVVLTDILPGSVDYVSATPGQGSWSQVGGVVTCSLGELQDGGSTSVEIVVTSTIAGSLTNNASVSADTADTNQGNKSASETTSVKPVEPEASSDIFLPLILKNNG